MMWIVEGQFPRPGEKDDNSATDDTPIVQRWLKPNRFYSVGRDSRNDFQLRSPRSLSRYNAIKFDISPVEPLDSSRPKCIPPEPIKPYSVSVTNQSNHLDLVLLRTDDSRINVQPGSSVDIKPGDKLFLEHSATSSHLLRFIWRSVNICFTALAPKERVSMREKSQSIGFSITEARFPDKEHTHFLPKPIKPTLPIGYAMVEGIELISRSWLDGFFEAASSNRDIKPLPAPFPQQPNETTQKYELRFQKMASCHDPRILKWSDFEIDFEAALEKLKPLKLSIDGSTIASAFRDWLPDPTKSAPNPGRKSLFSRLSVILLRTENDEEFEGVKKIVQAGQGTMMSILPTTNDFLSLSQEVQNWWSQQPQPRDLVLIKTKLATSLTTCHNLINQIKLDFDLESEKTTNDLLNAIYHTDRSQLVELSRCNVTDVDTNHTLSHQAPSLRNSIEHAAHSTQCSLSTSHGKGSSGATFISDNMSIRPSKSFAKSLSNSTGAGLLPTSSIAPRRNLIRRTTSRTDEVIEKKLEQLFSDNNAETAEIDRLKMQARIDRSVDYSLTPTQADHQATNSVETSNEFHNENASCSNPGSTLPSHSPVKVTCKPLLKRKNQDRKEPDLTQFMPFQMSMSAKQDLPENAVIDDSAKRPRIDSFPRTQPTATNKTWGKLTDVNISSIIGPASGQLEIGSEPAKNGLERKERSVMPISEQGELGDETTRQKQKRKRSHLRSQSRWGESGTEALDSEEIDTSNPDRKRKRGGNSADRITKKSGSKETDKDADQDSADCYLAAKVTGKRLTKEEIEINLEFNRLRIAKPLVILKNKSIPTRRIGWDEEDRSENELREMDDWNQETDHPSSKSFFKTKYVNMLRKPTASRQNSYETQNNEECNFKKFKPKNQSLRALTPAYPSRCNTIRMETVGLQRGVQDHEFSKRPQKFTLAQAPTEIGDEDSDDNNVQVLSTTFGKPTSSRRAQSGTAASKRAGRSPTRSQSKHQEKSSTSSDETISHSMNQSQARKSARSRNQSVQSSLPSNLTAIKKGKQKTESNLQTRRLEYIESDSESDGDELAFKGFTRKH